MASGLVDTLILCRKVVPDTCVSGSPTSEPWRPKIEALNPEILHALNYVDLNST